MFDGSIFGYDVHVSNTPPSAAFSVRTDCPVAVGGLHYSVPTLGRTEDIMVTGLSAAGGGASRCAFHLLASSGFGHPAQSALPFHFSVTPPPLPTMQSSPVLWKELAKDVRASKSLLEGFLEPVSALPSITDHRTQELVFEAAYRLWKVRRPARGILGSIVRP